MNYILRNKLIFFLLKKLFMDNKNNNKIIYQYFNYCDLCDTCCDTATFVKGDTGYYICKICVHTQDVSEFHPVRFEDKIMIYID